MAKKMSYKYIANNVARMIKKKKNFPSDWKVAFDPDWYRSVYPDVAQAKAEPIQHFNEYGWRENRNPHPLFDTQWYLQNNPDVAQANVNPYIHFLEHGWRENRNPSPHFDVDWYLLQNPDVAQAGINPYLHYIEYGQKEGRPARPTALPPQNTLQTTQHADRSHLYHFPTPDEMVEWFDATWYVQQYAEVAQSGLSPYVHFATIGWKKQYNPHPLFDVNWFLDHNPKAKKEADGPVQFFLHHMTEQNEKRSVDSRLPWKLSQQAFGDISAILPSPYVPPGREQFHGTSDAEFAQRLATVDVVSFDIFDTALFRTVGHPLSVFMIWNNKFSGRFKSVPYQLSDIRYWAEREARTRKHATHDTHEITLQDIYDVIEEKLQLQSHDTLELMKEELRIEADVLKSNPQILKWADLANKAGKKVIFVSDMYLPALFLQDVLTNNGYQKSEVYVSGEHQAGKWNRELFAIVEKQTGCNGNRILHIGDNHGSDKLNPESVGWQAIHYQEGSDARPFFQQISTNPLVNAANITTSVAMGLAHVHRTKIEHEDISWEEKFARYIGYELVGPLILGFTGWIASQAQRTSIDQIVFLARDGLLPFEAFKRIKRHLNLNADACYVAASRRLLYGAHLRTHEDIIRFSHNLLFSINSTLAEYMDVYNLSEEDYREYIQKYGFKSAHDKLFFGNDFNSESLQVRDRLMPLIRELAPVIKKKAKKNINYMKMYYNRNIPLGKEKRISIVDFGWSGTLIKPIDQIIRSIDSNVSTSALFFGLNASANQKIPSSIPAEGYFFNRKNRSSKPFPYCLPSLNKPCDVVSESLSLLEILISANHPTIIGLKRNFLGFQEIYAKDTYTHDQRLFLQNVHNACLSFIDDSLPLLPSHVGEWDFQHVIGHGWQRLLASPSAHEADLLGKFPHRMDPSGHGANTTLIANAEKNSSAENLWNQYYNSFWPAGWFAILDDNLRSIMLSKK